MATTLARRMEAVATTLARRIAETVATTLAACIEETVATTLAACIEEAVATTLVRPIEETVTTTSAALSRRIWTLVRAELIARGIEQAVNILDPWAPGIIEIILKFVLDKILSAAFNL